MANNLILAISFGFKLNSNLKCNPGLQGWKCSNKILTRSKIPLNVAVMKKLYTKSEFVKVICNEIHYVMSCSDKLGIGHFQFNSIQFYF